MQRFLQKVTLFLMFPIMFFMLNMMTNYFFYKNQTIPIKKTKTLIVGDSHTQRSLNPKYLHDALNISQTAEPYILTFWKLKKIFSIHTPDTLIIGFAPHNISQFNDFKFSNKKWSNEMFRRIYPIHEFSKISGTINIDYTNLYKSIWRETAFYPKKNHINYIGQYSNNNNSNIGDWETTINRHYYYDNTRLGVSEIAVNYLDSIVELADLKKVDIVIVSNPVHKKYLKKIPNSIMQKYIGLTKMYSANHIVFDRTTDNYPDSHYLNSDHLNEMGAKRFTEELIKFLKQKH